MAATKSKGPNKSEFVRRLLARSPETNLRAVNAEWKKAGHTGSISNPLFYQIKSKTKSTSAKGSANGTSASTIITKKPAAAKSKKGGPMKSAFVRELLGRTPEANLKAVNEAWNKAGCKGSISSTLLHLVKSKMKNASMKGSATGATAGKPGARKPTKQVRSVANGHSAVAGGDGELLDELEVEIDDLIFRLKGLGGMPEAEEALRQARRFLVRTRSRGFRSSGRTIRMEDARRLH
jgi:hypothetical protein